MFLRMKDVVCEFRYYGLLGTKQHDNIFARSLLLMNIFMDMHA